MFDYADPVRRNFLSNYPAEAAFCQQLQRTYDGFARRVNSTLTWIEAFGQFSDGHVPDVKAIE